MTQVTDVAFYTAATWSSLRSREPDLPVSKAARHCRPTCHGIKGSPRAIEVVVPSRKSYAVQRHHGTE